MFLVSFAGNLYHRLKLISKKFSRKGLYEWLDQQIAAMPPGANLVLNIGAGGAVFQKIQKIDAEKILQVDIDPDRKPDIVADACDMNMFADRSVDAIFLIEVLEHINQPWLAVKELHRILKPGGKIFVTTPFIFPIHDRPYDFYRYTEYGLAYLFNDFENVNIDRRNSYTQAIYVLFARAMFGEGKKSKLAGAVIFSLSLLLLPLFLLADIFYKNDAATTGYVLSAIKPPHSTSGDKP